MISIIDGDIAAFKIAFYYQARSTDPTNDPNLKQKSCEAVKSLVDQWAISSGCDTFYVALSSPKTFRHELCPNYKAHRLAKDKPIYLRDIFTTIQESFDCIRLPKLEADDIMGILSTHPVYANKITVVSTDKDLLQIPGRHFNPDKDFSPKNIPEDIANDCLLRQWLMGDSGDNIKGIPGVGQKRSEGLLLDLKKANGTRFADLYGAIIKTYIDKGCSVEEALKNYKLVKILRYDDIDEDMENSWANLPALES